MATHDDRIVDALGRRVLELERGCLVRDEPGGRYAGRPPTAVPA